MSATKPNALHGFRRVRAAYTSAAARARCAMRNSNGYWRQRRQQHKVRMGYGNWDPVLGAGYWDTGFSISPFLSLGLCVSFFLCLPQFRHSIFILFVVFFCIFMLRGGTTTEHPHGVTPNRQQIATLATFIRVNELSIRSGVATAAESSCCVCCNLPVPCSCLASTRFFCYFFFVPCDLWKLSKRGKPTLCKRMWHVKEIVNVGPFTPIYIPGEHHNSWHVNWHGCLCHCHLLWWSTVADKANQ